MKEVFCSLLSIYLVVLLARAIMSFFPIRPGTAIGSIYRVLVDLTEPVLAPMRRVIPPAGMFDISFLVLFIVIQLVLGAMHCPATLF